MSELSEEEVMIITEKWYRAYQKQKNQAGELVDDESWNLAQRLFEESNSFESTTINGAVSK